MSTHQSNNLNKRGCQFSIVLNDNELNLFKSASYVVTHIMFTLKDYLFIACIMHDLDFDNERKQMKTKHYHIVITFNGNYRVSTIINFLVDIFHCNANQVQCEKCNNVVSQVRYLIHLDDRDKHQYSKDDIVTTDDKKVNDCISSIKQIIDVDDLFKIMDEYPSLRKLISVIGVDNYKKWRSVILDVRKGY